MVQVMEGQWLWDSYLSSLTLGIECLDSLMMIQAKYGFDFIVTPSLVIVSILCN
jgi:hypothetical protein